ncbi:MAG TPA: cellulose biosynthesis protein BcsS, partial [Pseudolabrys sp.]|nr:cellulose biosynthesis protein BcsS [Pseudolabrys sp.]
MPPDPAHADDADDAQIMLFSGRDIWRSGAFAYGGFMFAPGGFDQDGILLKIMLSGGLYRYNAQNLGGAQVT